MLNFFQILLLFIKKYVIMNELVSGCVGMADEADSKSVVSNHVWVQVPPPAPPKRWLNTAIFLF